MYFEPAANSISKTDHTIMMIAEHGTNLFNAPEGTVKENHFPYMSSCVRGDFRARCYVEVEFAALYDLGCIVAYDHADKWIKFAFENSDAGAPSIVSVVTNGTSDDCNGVMPGAKGVWLQMCRRGNVFSLHYSLDGSAWALARTFSMEMAEEIRVGISAQCPVGQTCTAHFTDFEVTDNPYQDMRMLR